MKLITSNKKKYAIIALVMMAFAACKKDKVKVENLVSQSGKETKMTLKITHPKIMGAYASTDPNATDAEVKVNSIDVFVFEGIAPFKKVSTLSITRADKIYDAHGNLRPQVIPTMTGYRMKIFVGINLERTLVTGVDSYASLSDARDVDMAKMVSPTDGSVMMFNQQEETVTISDDESQNNFTIPVSRLVAKVAVQSGSALALNSISDGTLSDLEFTTGQNNKKYFIAPLTDFTDPNWLNSNYDPVDLSLVDETTYESVNAAGATGPTQAVKYMAENTSKEHAHRQVTYVSVKAKFTPATVTGATAIGSDGTFYAVFRPTGVFYFGDLTEAQAYSTTHGVPAPTTYTNGNCYYRLYLNPDAVTEGKYDVLRNVFYQATITKISKIGTAGKDDIDPIIPINPSKNTSIVATVTIVPWTMHTADYEI